LAPALRLKTEQEKSSFEFFAVYSNVQLRGFLDSPFWQREILQAAYQNEAIQHCIIALGAMHRRFHEGSNSHINEADVTDEYLQFALRQSNQAIQEIMKTSSAGPQEARPDKVTLMVCAILFSSMACLQGHQREGLLHLQSGIKMLNELDREGTEKPESHPVDVESLRSIFLGLDIQAHSIMNGDARARWESVSRTVQPKVLEPMDVESDALLAIERYFQALFSHALSFLQDTIHRSTEERDDVYHGYVRLLRRLDHGTDTLQMLCAKSTQSKSDDSQPLTALQLLQSQLEYVLRSPRQSLERKFEFVVDPTGKKLDIASHFTRMLDLASKLLPNNPKLPPVFTTASGPLQALWLIATRAPSDRLDLRKRAAALMRSCPRREGFWDGSVASSLIDQVMKIEQESTREEFGLSEDPGYDLIVPEDLRIINVALSYDEEDDRKAQINFRSGRDMAQRTPGRDTMVTW